MNTNNPKRKISRIMKYRMHRIPNVSHHRCGAAFRHVFTEVYSRMCAVRNQTSESAEVRTDRLFVPRASVSGIEKERRRMGGGAPVVELGVRLLREQLCRRRSPPVAPRVVSRPRVRDLLDGALSICCRSSRLSARLSQAISTRNNKLQARRINVHDADLPLPRPRPVRARARQRLSDDPDRVPHAERPLARLPLAHPALVGIGALVVRRVREQRHDHHELQPSRRLSSARLTDTNRDGAARQRQRMRIRQRDEAHLHEPRPQRPHDRYQLAPRARVRPRLPKEHEHLPEPPARRRPIRAAVLVVQQLLGRAVGDVLPRCFVS